MHRAFLWWRRGAGSAPSLSLRGKESLKLGGILADGYESVLSAGRTSEEQHRRNLVRA